MRAVVGCYWSLRVTACVLVIAGAWVASRAEAAPTEGKNPPPAKAAKDECVKVHAQAPYRGYGYDHIVELRNTCPKPAVCQVATDVSPTAVEQSVPAGETRQVLTLRGSPASTFVPAVSCKVAP